MHFDINVARGVVTVVWFLTFIALCGWAWSSRRRKDFAAAARLPLDEAGDVTVPEGDGE